MRSSPFRFSRPADQSEVPANVEAAAEACQQILAHEFPAGELRLLGWSYGGLVAYEVARRLHDSGRTGCLLFIVDVAANGVLPQGHDVGARPPHPKARTAGPATLDALRITSPLPAELDPADEANWLAGVQARIDAAKAHRPRPAALDIVLVRGTESITGRRRGRLLGWDRIVQGKLELEWVPGTHDSLMRGEGARSLAALVERTLTERSR